MVEDVQEKWARPGEPRVTPRIFIRIRSLRKANPDKRRTCRDQDQGGLVMRKMMRNWPGLVLYLSFAVLPIIEYKSYTDLLYSTNHRVQVLSRLPDIPGGGGRSWRVISSSIVLASKDAFPFDLSAILGSPHAAV